MLDILLRNGDKPNENILFNDQYQEKYAKTRKRIWQLDIENSDRKENEWNNLGKFKKCSRSKEKIQVPTTMQTKSKQRIMPTAAI
ncbi:hypothetical protein EWB00_004968 [Schistosoma japonicum]|uniref:Uncharacterized protein n=1 Tax=Schistosoma japonicum TaxID=6182 RepID=A0A4Z2D3B2_SCHJA|nr:hypothetical protein EWB00_004968 [Schistosoma japonicum]